MIYFAGKHYTLISVCILFFKVAAFKKMKYPCFEIVLQKKRERLPKDIRMEE